VVTKKRKAKRLADLPTILIIRRGNPYRFDVNFDHLVTIFKIRGKALTSATSGPQGLPVPALQGEGSMLFGPI
jgi:hypothetical protein